MSGGKKNAPERIWATVNGARSVFPGGAQYLIGGWEGAPREHGTEYVRADVATDMLAALDQCPDPADSANSDDYREAVNKWWGAMALPAINAAKGLP